MIHWSNSGYNSGNAVLHLNLHSNPGRQVHLYEPMVFWQTAPPPHRAPRRHSLMSRQVSPSPEICLDFYQGEIFVAWAVDAGSGKKILGTDSIKNGKKG